MLLIKMEKGSFQKKKKRWKRALYQLQWELNIAADESTKIDEE